MVLMNSSANGTLSKIKYLIFVLNLFDVQISKWKNLICFLFLIFFFFVDDRLVDSPLEKDLMERFSGSLEAQEAMLNGLDSSKV